MCRSKRLLNPCTLHLSACCHYRRQGKVCFHEECRLAASICSAKGRHTFMLGDQIICGEAFENAKDCLIAALEGYVKAGRPIPHPPFKGARVVLPSLVTAKLAVYENMRNHGWTRSRLANELGMPENSVRRLLDLRHSSHMWVIDEALAKMNAELLIDLPRISSRRKTG